MRQSAPVAATGEEAEVRLVFSEIDGTTVCRPEGELESLTAGQLREAAAWLCGHRRVVFDLSAVDFIDSAGLGALVGAVRRIRESGGAVALFSSRATVTRLLRTAGVDRVVPLTGSLDEATATFIDQLAT